MTFERGEASIRPDEGRWSRHGRCLLLVYLLVACTGGASTPTQTGQPRLVCLDRAIFGTPAESPYLLPYIVGDSHNLLQSYCNPTNSHSDQLAYDIRMPVGTDVLAIAAGVVREIKEDWPDDGISSQNHNFIFLEHPDGTTAFYAHLMQWGVDVEVDDSVAQGERIAASGKSAVPIPLLHLGVYRTYPPRHEDDLAINFRNAQGELDGRGGLKTGVQYLALPH